MRIEYFLLLYSGSAGMKLRIYLNAIAAIVAAIGGTYLCLNNKVTLGSMVLASAPFSALRALIWYQKDHKRKNDLLA